MPSWMDWYPERFASEMDAYSRLGIQAHIDQEARARGILVLDVKFEHEKEQYDIQVTYPNLFPYFQPFAFLKNLRLKRHQHPDSGHLCLLGRGTKQWSSEDEFATVLYDRFPIILEINTLADNDAISKLEESQGEPFTEYFNGMAENDSAIIYDSDWVIDEKVSMGTAKLKVANLTSRKKDRPMPIVGYIDEIRHRDKILAQWKSPSFEQYHHSITLRWARLNDPPSGFGDNLIAQLSPEQKRHLEIEKIEGQREKTFLLIFKEEVEQFVYKDAIACITIYPKVIKSSGSRRIIYRWCHQRTFRGGAGDLAARMPAVLEIADKTVLCVGLGALGASATVHLARAGFGRLILVDFDYVDPATVRRWPIGASTFGQNKGQALQEFIEREYPWTEVRAVPLNIGIPQDDGGLDQFEQLAELLHQSDLVIDLTAENGVNELLSSLAKELSKPYIVGSATPGAWGGYVAHFTQDQKQPCWVCLMYDLYGGDWADDLPPEDPNGTLQPPGCPSRTFTGTAVDLDEISIEVVRVALGLSSRAYPMAAHQLEFLTLRDGGILRDPPRWESRAIKTRAECRCQM